MTNPLLDWAGPTPPWDAIKPEHLEAALDQVLAEARAKIQALLNERDFRWESFGAELEAIDNRIHKAFSPGGHLHAVCNTDEWRKAYEACLPKLTAYSTEMGQNSALFSAYQELEQDPTLNAAQLALVKHALVDFRLAGVELEPAKKQRYAEIAERLSELCNRFGAQLIDATEAWHLQVDNADDLAGLPDSALAMGRNKAESKSQGGYVFGLDFPSFDAIMTYAEDRELRQRMYEAYVTRASDSGPQAGQNDNGPLMAEILSLRQEEARLLGFKNYAEVSLATKMAPDPDAVESFLLELAERARPTAEKQLAQLSAFAQQHGATLPLQAWDTAYWSERFKEATLGLSDEMLRPYFSLPRVLEGLFGVAQDLFGIQVRPLDLRCWHPDAQAFAIDDADGQQRAWFFIDLYARDKKRGGAWMDDACGKLDEPEQQLPIATLTCNFRPPQSEAPALLTHDEVVTLFHEFGHGLHHMLTEVSTLGVGGISGVPWDAVELPSQFLENWCWEEQALEKFARHIDSGETLPKQLLEQLRLSRQFNAGLATLRQVELALFDLRLHRDVDQADGDKILALLDQVRDEVAVLKPPAWNRFANSFSHIFAGGYAAGYYSYKWAEVLSADAFGAFREEGIFNAETGGRFRQSILARGGSVNAMRLFEDFRGRPPKVDALLEQDGLAA